MTMYLDRKAVPFRDVEEWSATFTVRMMNRITADYIDWSDRRRREIERADRELAAIRTIPIAHDGSDRCPVLPGTAVYIRHRLNDVVLLSRTPERLTWSDVISWVPIMELP